MPTRSMSGVRMVAGRLLLPEEPFLHRGHAGVNQQKALVVVRHQGEAVKAKVPLPLKKGKIFFAQFIQSGPFHWIRFPHFIDLFDCNGGAKSVSRRGPHGKPKKIALAPQIRDEGRSASVVPPGLRADKNTPLFFAITPRCVPFLTGGCSGGCGAKRGNVSASRSLSVRLSASIGPVNAVCLSFVTFYYKRNRAIVKPFCANPPAILRVSKHIFKAFQKSPCTGPRNPL